MERTVQEDMRWESMEVCVCQRRTSHDGRIMKYFDEDYWEELWNGCRWDVAAEPQGALHRIRRCWLHNSCVTVSQWTTCSVDLPCAGSAIDTAPRWQGRPDLGALHDLVRPVLACMSHWKLSAMYFFVRVVQVQSCSLYVVCVTRCLSRYLARRRHSINVC